MTLINRTASARIINFKTGREITVANLRITFNITKTTKAGDNKGKIVIYNLSQESRKLAQSSTEKDGKPNTQIELSCGYREEPERLLFSGTGEVENTYAAPEWLTTIEVNDGLDKMQDTSFEKKFPAGTPVLDIVKNFLGSANISELVGSAIPGVIPKARTFSGDPLKNIQDLQSTYGFKFDIQNGQSIVTPDEVPVNERYLTRLDYSTGLINTPQIKGNLVICEALINPNLSPNNFVELASTNIDLQGEYRIEKAVFKGDTWGGAWTVKLELKRVTLFDPLRTRNLIINPSEVTA